jgi:nickel-type superoxide dismutase maturation protease
MGVDHARWPQQVSEELREHDASFYDRTVARRQRYHLALSVVLGLLAAVAAVAWRWWHPFAAAVEGPSMAPALRAGDLVLAVRPRRVRPGDVVIVEHPSRHGFELVKRVVAVEGDSMDGRLLGPGDVWLLGDAGEESTDSRSFGPVPTSAIRGVVVARYWPPRRGGVRC